MTRFNKFTGIGSAILTVAVLFPAQTIAAEPPQSAYQVVVIGNQAFGTSIVKGEHQTAIRRIASKSRLYPFAAASNLCAAHTMLGQLDDAERYCNQAIALVERASIPRPRHWKGRLQLASNGALAHSNRGVLRVLRGNKAGAEEDFRAAIELKADMRAPVHNFARMSMDAAEPVAVVVNSR